MEDTFFLVLLIYVSILMETDFGKILIWCWFDLFLMWLNLLSYILTWFLSFLPLTLRMTSHYLLNSSLYFSISFNFWGIIAVCSVFRWFFISYMVFFLSSFSCFLLSLLSVNSVSSLSFFRFQDSIFVIFWRLIVCYWVS